jgi:hypothetical protein
LNYKTEILGTEPEKMYYPKNQKKSLTIGSNSQRKSLEGNQQRPKTLQKEVGIT